MGNVWQQGHDHTITVLSPEILFVSKGNRISRVVQQGFNIKKRLPNHCSNAMLHKVRSKKTNRKIKTRFGYKVIKHK